MNKGKMAGVGTTAGQTLHLLGRMLLGGLCGVGAVWTLSALWPPSRGVIHTFGNHFQALSREYPAVILGLLLGMVASLIWQAVKK
jgi:hypothetical protein